MRKIKFRFWNPAIPKNIREAEDDKASGNMVNWEYAKKVVIPNRCTERRLSSDVNMILIVIRRKNENNKV